MNVNVTRTILAVLLSLGLTGLVAEEQEPDLTLGKQLHRQCALCHGQWSQGIIGGKYPRLAGYPEYYVIKMIERYKSKELDYPAMTVVGGLRTLSEHDIRSLAAYIASIDLDELSPLNIPTPAGDVKHGEKLFQSDCRTCHGRTAEGKATKESPPLRGQYTEYLDRQIAMFLKKERVHADDPDDETFASYEKEDLAAILAYIATLDDK